MSDMRIALIAEGKTDSIVIEATLNAILGDKSFILTQLQPETSEAFGGAGPHGGGWGGVYRWCRQMVSMSAHVSDNPTLTGYDLIILHVDTDVASMNYTQANIHDWVDDLPCQLPCPPVEDSVNALRRVIADWLGLTDSSLPTRWVFCTPSKCTEAWIVEALYPNADLRDIECNLNIEGWLSSNPISDGARLIQGGKKKTLTYREIAQQITNSWDNICGECSQARRFQNDVLNSSFLR